MAKDGGNLTVDLHDYPSFANDQIASKYLRKYVGSEQLLKGGDRWCIWLLEAKSGDWSSNPLLRSRFEKVAEFRQASDASSTREFAQYPHRFRQIGQPSVPYLCIPRVVSGNRKYFTTARFGPEVIASDAVFTAPDEDGFLFALISSSMFITWQKSIGGRLKSDYRFSSTIVWNNFPLHAVTQEQRESAILAGAAVLAARENHPNMSLAKLYDPERMPADLKNAHDALDLIVDPLFGVLKDATESDRQVALFERYAELTGQ